MPESLWRGMHERSVLPLWDRCLPRRRGSDTLTLAAASSGRGHVRAARGLPTPCRRGDSLHVSQPRISTVWAGGSSQCEDKQGRVVSAPNDLHLVRPGTCHRSMAQVRVLAGWLMIEVTCSAARHRQAAHEASFQGGEMDV